MAALRRDASVVVTFIVALVVSAHLLAQVPVPFTDKILDLRGEWTRDPTRRLGGICGVSDPDRLTFDIAADPAGIVFQGTHVPLDGTAAGAGRTVAASIDAGWLKLTFTQPRNGGYANVTQEVYILNRDRTEVTMWRTLNTLLPDGSSGKIDCGNHVALVFLRQK